MGKNKPQLKVERLEALDPTFQVGSVHTARAMITNPTSQEWTYDLELYLGATKVATSGVGSITISAGASQVMDFTLTMPETEGTYDVYLDAIVEGELIAHYKATEPVSIEVTPAILVGPITWL